MAGQAGAMRSAPIRDSEASKLVPYGIQQDKSDYRAHVCVRAGIVYVYPTESARKAIQERGGKQATAQREGTLTARGYLIEPVFIKPCDLVRIPYDLSHTMRIEATDSPSEKGAKATAIVREMVRRSLIQVSVDVVEVSDQEQQLDGIDLEIRTHRTMQVKCDFNGGDLRFGGTGHLFIQTHERNLDGSY